MFNAGSFDWDILFSKLLWLVLLISAILVMFFFYRVYWFLSVGFGRRKLSEKKVFKKQSEAIIQALKKQYDHERISQAQFESILKKYLEKPWASALDDEFNVSIGAGYRKFLAA